MGLDSYRPLEEIGRGGMGAVFKGRSPDGDAVAVKILLHPEHRKLLARFEREKRLLEELGVEAGFVPLLESGEAPQGPYLVMPFIEGGTLRDRLRRGPLSVEDTAKLGRALAAALARAHAAGIVHRDLKPENILFTPEGQPLIADLGLAKHFRYDDPDNRSVSLSNAGTAIGTLGYMAPEQMKNAKAAGPEVDVWALGTVLYECLTGAPPFRAQSALEVVRKATSGEREPLPRSVPAWLRAVVDRALSPRPGERFAAGSEMATAIEAGSRERGSAKLALGAIALIVLGAAGGAAGAVAGLSARKPPVVKPADPAGPLAAAVITSAAAPSAPAAGPPAETLTKKEKQLLDFADAALAAGKKTEAWNAYVELSDKAAEKDHPRLQVRALDALFGLAKNKQEKLVVLSELANVELKIGRFEGARDHGRAAIELSPEDATLRNNLAYVLHILGEDKEAMDEYRRCIDLDDHQYLARMSLGLLARSNGDPARARKAHRGLLEISKLSQLSETSWFFRFESKAALAKGPGVTFETERQRVALVRIEIALDEVSLDDLAAADAALAEAKKQHPQREELSPAIEKGLDDAQRALELEPSRHALHFVAGVLHAMNGEVEPARSELEAFRRAERERGGRYADRATELIDSLK